MITHIRMKNFKSWKDSGEVKLAPLTGFFGTNSSGKSSLLQMLLLLKQTAESREAEEVIFFGNNSSLVNLGNFQEVIHGHGQEKKLELEFGCILNEPFVIEVTGRKPDGRQGVVPVEINNYSFNTSIEKVTYNPTVDHIRYSFKSCDLTEVKWKEKTLSYDNSLNEQVKIRDVIKDCYGHTSSTIVLNRLSISFEKVFSHLYYLGPSRVDPQRHYSWSGGHPKHIKQWGNQTIDALLSARVRKLKTLHGTEEVPIDDKISDWLQKMDLAHSFTLDWTSQGAKEYEVRIQKSPTSAAVTLADMGYGLSQFLPVLVLCYYAPEGSTLILEQPGIHLHPKVQSELADLLIEVVNERNLQILVESHSEHLLNRLQRRIAEEKISVEKTSLYFCRNDEGVSNIERLKMDEFGNISNWPENFFGNEMGELFARAEAEMERRKKMEG